MGYVILGAIVIITILPFSIRNRTKFLQERISKKAAMLGVDLDFRTVDK